MSERFTSKLDHSNRENCAQPVDGMGHIPVSYFHTNPHVNMEDNPQNARIAFQLWRMSILGTVTRKLVLSSTPMIFASFDQYCQHISISNSKRCRNLHHTWLQSQPRSNPIFTHLQRKCCVAVHASVWHSTCRSCCR